MGFARCAIFVPKTAELGDKKPKVIFSPRRKPALIGVLAIRRPRPVASIPILCAVAPVAIRKVSSGGDEFQKGCQGIAEKLSPSATLMCAFAYAARSRRGCRGFGSMRPLPCRGLQAWRQPQAACPILFGSSVYQQGRQACNDYR